MYMYALNCKNVQRKSYVFARCCVSVWEQVGYFHIQLHLYETSFTYQEEVLNILRKYYIYIYKGEVLYILRKYYMYQGSIFVCFGASYIW